MNTYKTVQTLHGHLTKREILRRHIKDALSGGQTTYALTDIASEIDTTVKQAHQIVTWLRDHHADPNMNNMTIDESTDMVVFGSTTNIEAQKVASENTLGSNS